MKITSVFIASFILSSAMAHAGDGELEKKVFDKRIIEEAVRIYHEANGIAGDVSQSVLEEFQSFTGKELKLLPTSHVQIWGCPEGPPCPQQN